MTKYTVDDALSELRRANEKINLLERALANFIGEKPYRMARKPNAEAGKDDIFFEVVTPIGAHIHGMLGAIIKGQKTSLDIFTKTLAAQSGFVKPEDVQFPVCESEFVFASKGFQDTFRLFRDRNPHMADQLKPYRGGNAFVYGLNWLARKDENRALAYHFAGIEFTVPDYTAPLTGFSAEPEKLFENGSHVTTIPSEYEGNVYLTTQIAFRNFPESGPQRVIKTLKTFNELIVTVIRAYS